MLIYFYLVNKKKERATHGNQNVIIFKNDFFGEKKTAQKLLDLFVCNEIKHISMNFASLS